jgi:hypothetical protein
VCWWGFGGVLFDWRGTLVVAPGITTLLVPPLWASHETRLHRVLDLALPLREPILPAPVYW